MPPRDFYIPPEKYAPPPCPPEKINTINDSKLTANCEGLYLYNEYVLMILVILFLNRDL